MKKIWSFIVLIMAFISQIDAQSCYWVFLTDKKGTTFDPYSYFDAKAIERYKLNNADLYDITNYPLNEQYVAQVDAIATEEVGTSRWFNAIGVMATPDQIAKIEALPFVKEVQMIASEMQIASYRAPENTRWQNSDNWELTIDSVQPQLSNQLIRFQGELFRSNGINAKGIRIAVFDNGFTAVNTHDAFKHLRDNGQIKATWNFCKKREDVYGWGTHGTMVLSCIAGIINGKQLGLATGAEFILARTEIPAEPFKEEVWWAQAVEWADKNGANVINSSLGYGKQRHFTYEMDGRSYVAKAANLAARKGMLVCNSAGNEGDDNSWKTIITPSDADSVLCVGGIQDDLGEYRHISFSSYGPSADGRLKPNIAAFGRAEVANPSKDHQSIFAYGTSFASPLAAGFCACAWQTRPGLTAMQMKEEIEHSCDRYPYYDYALGYGVPQAQYFIEKEHKEKLPTFSFRDTLNHILVVIPSKQDAKKAEKSNRSIFDTKESNDVVSIVEDDTYTSISELKTPTVFFKTQNDKGVIDNYTFCELELNNTQYIAFPKSGLIGHKLVVSYKGYTAEYELSAADRKHLLNSGEASEFTWEIADENFMYSSDYSATLEWTPEDNEVSSFKDGNRWNFDFSYSFGTPIKTTDKEMAAPKLFDRNDINFQIQMLLVRNLCQHYGLGVGASWGIQSWEQDIDVNNAAVNALHSNLGISGYNTAYLSSSIFNNTHGDLEFFQRVNITQGSSIVNNGIYWDLGIFGSLNSRLSHTLFYDYSENPTMGTDSETRRFHHIDAPYFSRLQWGLSTRVVFDVIGIYARYNMTRVEYTPSTIHLPKLDVGLIIGF